MPWYYEDKCLFMSIMQSKVILILYFYVTE